jgi:hypothetical protein
MNHYVYLIEKKNALPNQEKYYIGVRSCECKIGEDSYMSSSDFLKEDIKKVGKENFNKIILKRFQTREDAYAHEIQLHKEFDVANNPLFFNRANQLDFGFGGGIGENNAWFGKEHSVEWKKEKSIKMTGNKNAAGYKHTEEARQIIKAKRAEQVFSQESLDKLKGRTPWNKGKTGLFKHTDEHKQKLALRWKGNKYNVGRVLTDEEKRNKSEQNKGLVWMNNGQKNFRIKPSNVDAELNQGLILGFYKNKA